MTNQNQLVRLVALQTFSGEEGCLRAGMHFMATAARAKVLCSSVAGQRRELAKRFAETQAVAPVMETKGQSKETKPKRTRNASKKEAAPTTDKLKRKTRRTRKAK